MKHLFSFLKHHPLGIAAGLLGLSLTSCTGIDCPLDSVVVWTLSFYDSDTEEALSLPYTLDVDAAGAGTLYNKGTGITSMELPMSAANPTDTLYLKFYSDEQEATDTLYVDHTNYAHFEAMDCPGAVFHTITATRNTTHSISDMPIVIDSVSIIRPQVDYNDVENIRLYLHTSDTDADSDSSRRID